ncbi:tRNA pseudouridine(13) synthase TruD [Candidatus Bathyarchaeota archaeon]|nr:MAG: tRNA pseudouridine(13) synthase TruD [Candidatus Bathyarchaeota archaeon]
MSSDLPDINLDLPFITKDYPGIGGKIREKSSHFLVEEIPLYNPDGTGIHLYLNITKEGMTTRDVQLKLAELFNQDPSEVGKAGLKDKYAITTQNFSVVFDGEQPDPDEIIKIVEAEMPVKVNWAKYHSNKLRAGHLEGNRFTITITDAEDDALALARKIADRIHMAGMPNYYGVQRTGKEGENIIQGWLLLKGKKRLGDRWLRKYLISSYQSYLCNRYLVERIEQGKFTELIHGDLAKKHDTGGIFWVEELETEQPRFNNKEISFTAPMYGYKMRQAKYESSDLETRILDSVTITVDDLRKNHIKGTRRLGRILPEISLGENQDGLEISFTLPKGSFATTVLREFMKNDQTID